jgi:hypothetical protein
MSRWYKFKLELLYWRGKLQCLFGTHEWEYVDNGHGGVHMRSWMQCAGCSKSVDDEEEWSRINSK